MQYENRNARAHKRFVGLCVAVGMGYVMFLIFLFIAIICFSFSTGVYGLYFLLVLKTSKKSEYLQLIRKAVAKELSPQQLPVVSILIPAYNEEKVISRKIRSIAALDYPREKTEVILIDDGSTDNTVEIAQQMFSTLNLPGKIIRNGKKIGVNASYNKGVEESKGDWILTTDADVTFDHDALTRGAKILSHLEKAGGISARMISVSSDHTAAVLIQNSYQSFYDSMLIAESAMYSTFPAYSPFTLLRKSAFSPLPPTHGSSDGNISLATIKKGLQFLYVPEILFYEPIPLRVAEQRRQKVRRACRLIQSTLANRDMLFNGKYKSFGRIIFPLRFAMMVICPVALVIGFAAMVVGTIYLSIALPPLLILLFSFCTFLGMKSVLRELNVFSSFVAHQFYLIMGLFLSQKSAAAWRPPERSEMITASQSRLC